MPNFLHLDAWMRGTTSSFRGCPPRDLGKNASAAVRPPSVPYLTGPRAWACARCLYPIRLGARTIVEAALKRASPGASRSGNAGTRIMVARLTGARRVRRIAPCLDGDSRQQSPSAQDCSRRRRSPHRSKQIRGSSSALTPRKMDLGKAADP